MKALVPLILLASPAAAQTLDLPAECVPFVTVQQSHCSVTTYARCDGDPEGSIRSIGYNGLGLDMVHLYSSTWHWLDSDYQSYREQLFDTIDPIDIVAMHETGSDSWDFAMESAVYGMSAYFGEESLTGWSRTLDGFDMLETEFTITGASADGTPFLDATGQEWLIPELGIILGGEVMMGNGTDKPEPWDFTPVSLSTPGTDGFLSTVPTTGCTD